MNELLENTEKEIAALMTPDQATKYADLRDAGNRQRDDGRQLRELEREKRDRERRDRDDKRRKEKPDARGPGDPPVPVF